MYNKATLDNIAGKLGLNAEEFATGYASDKEVEVKIAEGRFMTTEQEETLKSNHGKTRYDAGAEASREMQLKDMSKKAGFEETIKDASKFMEAYKVSILKDAKIEPDKKIKEFETSMENLRTKLTEKDNDYLALQKDVANNKIKFDARAFMPELPESLGINKDDATNLYFMTHEVKTDGIYKNGVIQKDSYEKSLTQKESIDAFISDKKWNATPAGRGGGAGGSGSDSLPTTMEEFESTLKEKGLNIGSQEANSLLSEIAKKNPEILD